MDIFYPTIIEPLLQLRRPQSIVEIGAEGGDVTRLLLKFSQTSGGTVHTIDPRPRFDVAQWQQQFGSKLVVHALPSLEALPAIDRFDVVLIDGDHNWYTVFHELKFIDAATVRSGQAFPVVLLHDIGWPYGRRDMYYNPNAIPAQYRQPCFRNGMLPDLSALQEQGGFNARLWNADHEGGPRNGVLTAVEDFVKQSSRPLELVQVVGFNGLGVLFPRELKERDPGFAQFIAALELSPTMRAHLEKLENTRNTLMVYLREYEEALRQQQAPAQSPAASPTEMGEIRFSY